jgi:hypothetical protein
MKGERSLSPDGVPVFHARRPVFPILETTAQRLTFADPARDCPWRNSCNRAGNNLMPRIEGDMDDQIQETEWRYRKAEPKARRVG